MEEVRAFLQQHGSKLNLAGAQFDALIGQLVGIGVSCVGDLQDVLPDNLAGIGKMNFHKKR